ncbi:MAG: DUF1616 domain-containing protein [Nitrososphaeria archaeon]
MRPRKTGEKELREKELKDLIVDVLREEKPRSVSQLVDSVLTRIETDVSIPDVVRLVHELGEEGRITLSQRPRMFETFTSYLLDRKFSLSLWLVFAAVILTWISIYLIPSEFPWVTPRWVLGTLFVIFLPGYAFIEALFVNPISGKKELDQIARFALSIGMSLALVPLIGLLLNYTPWGIRLEPIAVSLSIFTLICIFVAAYRKFTQRATVRRLIA